MKFSALNPRLSLPVLGALLLAFPPPEGTAADAPSSALPNPAPAPDVFPPLTFLNPAAAAKLQPRHASLDASQPGFVRIAFERAEWPNVSLSAGRSYASTDWSNVGALAIELRNPEATPLEVHIRVDDSPEANGSVHCRTASATLEANERTSLLVPLDPETPGMRAGPPVAIAGPHRRCDTGGVVSCRNISGFQIFLAKPDRAHQLDLFAIRWLPKVELRGIVDRYGQFSGAEWPGKIHSDEELARAKTEEAGWLHDHLPPPDRDEFGGWKTGPQLPQTGFFRTEKVAGRWWLVTPSGHLFWSLGVDCVRTSEQSPIRGREAMFSWLPDGAAKSGWCDFYQTGLRRKYGETWASDWARLACQRLPAWGFNTIGNWSDPSVFRLRRVPYTATVHLSGLPRIGPAPEEGKHDHRLPDYFDDAFPAKAEAAIAKAVAEWRDDPWCIGYFVDNELGWDSWAQGGLGGQTKIARETLITPAPLAARTWLSSMLRKKYGGIEAFAKAWNVQASSWDEPIAVPASGLPAGAREDCAAFLTAMADRYFSVVSAALKRQAPHQLYLGCRFAVRPKEAVEIAAKYCDVVSFNIYDDAVKPEKWSFTNDLGKPVIIGEFHFGALDRGLFHPGLRRTANQPARAEAFSSYVRSVLAMPAFVGCHWFQYADEPLTGRFDGENYNIGLVTVTDTPYPELRAAARQTGSQIYSLRTSAPELPPVPARP